MENNDKNDESSTDDDNKEGDIVDPKLNNEEYELLISIKGDPDIMAKFAESKKKAHMIKKCWSEVAKELTSRVDVLHPGSRRKFSKDYANVSLDVVSR